MNLTRYIREHNYILHTLTCAHWGITHVSIYILTWYVVMPGLLSLFIPSRVVVMWRFSEQSQCILLWFGAHFVQLKALLCKPSTSAFLLSSSSPSSFSFPDSLVMSCRRKVRLILKKVSLYHSALFLPPSFLSQINSFPSIFSFILSHNIQMSGIIS